MCLDCDAEPCRCAEYEEAQRWHDAEEAERAATAAETDLDYLWEPGPGGLLSRKRG